MRRTLQLIACATAVWLGAPPTVTADPIAITSGVITLGAESFGGGPITLTGTDGTRMFTFAGTISDIDPEAFSCHPCVSQIGIDINAVGAAHGTLTYGNETYHVGGFEDTEGALVLFVEGGPIPLPAPLALGEIRSFSTPFMASGRVVPPGVPGDGLMNTLTGSGIATVTLSGGPGNEVNPLVWDIRRAEYKFSAAGGPAPIPEPASFLLFASGLCALVLKRRSRIV